MSASDELRRMLDERGVEWKEGEGWYDTEWTSQYGARCRAVEWNPTLSVMLSYITPEQAIEATLGPETCHTVEMDCFGNPPFNQSGLNGNSTACGCSNCGAPWSTCGLFRGNLLKHNFVACPRCGAKVVDDDSDR